MPLYLRKSLTTVIEVQRTISVVSVYAPSCSRSTHDKKEQFHEDIQDLIDGQIREEPVTIYITVISNFCQPTAKQKPHCNGLDLPDVEMDLIGLHSFLFSALLFTITELHCFVSLLLVWLSSRFSFISRPPLFYYLSPSVIILPCYMFCPIPFQYIYPLYYIHYLCLF